MKKILVIFAFLIMTCSSEPNEKAEPIFILKTNQGFSIYSHDKELLLELSNINTDSLSLETLRYICEVANEYREHPDRFKDNKEKLKRYSEVLTSGQT